MKFNSEQESLINGFNREKIAWMYKKDFPSGYKHNSYPPYWALKIFADNEGYLPIPLNGSRLCMWNSEFPHRFAVDSIYSRAFRMLKITLFAQDKNNNHLASKYRIDLYNQFIEKFIHKFHRRYPRQRANHYFTYYNNYINGVKVDLNNDDLEREIENHNNQYLALLMCENVIKKISTLEKLTKK